MILNTLISILICLGSNFIAICHLLNQNFPQQFHSVRKRSKIVTIEIQIYEEIATKVFLFSTQTLF